MDSQPKLLDLVWGLAADWCSFTLIRWTVWPLAGTFSSRQHHKYSKTSLTRTSWDRPRTSVLTEVCIIWKLKKSKLQYIVNTMPIPIRYINSYCLVVNYCSRFFSSTLDAPAACNISIPSPAVVFTARHGHHYACRSLTCSELCGPISPGKAASMLVHCMPFSNKQPASHVPFRWSEPLHPC